MILVSLWIIAMVILSAGVVVGLASLGQPAPAPNVIVILPDALRADRLSCYVPGSVQTPHIDALARDGVLYRNMNAQAAWTKPSVATIFTSLYPSTHQARRPKDILPDAVLTLPEVLSAHGYRTAAFVTNTNLFPDLNFQQGYAEYHALDPAETTWRHDGQKFYQEAALVNEQVLAWLNAAPQQPFFLYIHYMDPHRPYFQHPY
ncbi:MAG: sulfatase-like hydrolase/transferase, partial [Chloroflexi bacterium]|nr:sulfatase-like hydrolase/transferase [Chloroflexota bacterium]